MSIDSGHVSRIAAIVIKDLRAFARDRLWLVLTPFSLLFVAAGYWLAPTTVEEGLWLGLSPPESVELLRAIAGNSEDEIHFIAFEGEDRLEAAVAGTLEHPTEEEGRVSIGLAFPADFRQSIEARRQPLVTLHVAPGISPELEHALVAEVREIGFAAEAVYTDKTPAHALPVSLPDQSEMILGEDRAGRQVAMRDKLRPMLAIFILLLSSIAIAGLVASEIERKTATAILVTPTSTADFLAAKGVTGALLGLVQVALFMLLTLSFGGPLWLIALLLTLGALMMSAIGIIAGCSGRDFMSTMFIAVAAIVPMAIPSFTVLFPGSDSLWIEFLPSYGFVEAMVGVMGYGRAPSEVALDVGLAAGWTVALSALAFWLLGRRVEAL